MVLLTGRPSRLPAVRSVFEEMMAVPPHRLVSMHAYKTGRWYPFRDPVSQRIGDPKSTVAVGGMLIALSESRIPNFKVDTRAFRMQSTARYIGEMDSSGQITNDRVLFSNVDLDERKSPADMIATLTMYTPIYLGSRQLPLERWTTTPLYRLERRWRRSRSPSSGPTSMTTPTGKPRNRSSSERRCARRLPRRTWKMPKAAVSGRPMCGSDYIHWASKMNTGSTPACSGCEQRVTRV